MTRATRFVGLPTNSAGVLACVLAAATGGGCAWEPIDALALVDAGTRSTYDANTTGPGDIDAGDTSDAGGTVDATNGGGAPDAAASSSAACGAPGPFVDEWTFDASVESWTVAVDPGVLGNVSWTAATGEPSPGALELEVTPSPADGGSAGGAWLQVNGSYGDLTGRTVTAWIWLDSGEGPQLKVFAQSGPQYGWEDDGTIHLLPRTWTCVSLPVSTPSYEQAWFDPTDVIRIGFEMLSDAPFRVMVDSVHVR